MKEKYIQQIMSERIIVICRKIYGMELYKLTDTIHKAGLRMIEVTFDQMDPDCNSKTAEAIKMLNDSFGSDMLVGAGTVLSPLQVALAKNSGAKVIISPNTNEQVIAATLAGGMVSVPGAATPTEILLAHSYGADIVKLFPIASLGLQYVKDIMAPISHVKLMATGGVTEENLPLFLKAGMVGAGIGGYIANRKCIEENNWEELHRRAKALVDVVKEV